MPADLKKTILGNAELAISAISEKLHFTTDELRRRGIAKILEQFGRACAHAAQAPTKPEQINPFKPWDKEKTRSYPSDHPLKKRRTGSNKSR